MANPKTPASDSAQEMRVTLGLLTAVSTDSLITQRSLSNDLGIALGLANAYLRRCIRKGHIKISQIRPNRCAYYLTPKGFAEKSRLTASYLSQSFLLFRNARIDYKLLLDKCEARGWRRIVLFGTGDLGEIVKICAMEMNIEIVATVDELDELPQFDAIVITDLQDPQTAYESAKERFSDRVLYPAILNITENRAQEEGLSG